MDPSVALLLDKHWYYRIEVEPGVFTPGRHHSNLAVCRSLLDRIDLTNKRCLDIRTQEFIAPIVMLDAGAAEVIASQQGASNIHDRASPPRVIGRAAIGALALALVNCRLVCRQESRRLNIKLSLERATSRTERVSLVLGEAFVLRKLVLCSLALIIFYLGSSREAVSELRREVDLQRNDVLFDYAFTGKLRTFPMTLSVIGEPDGHPFFATLRFQSAVTTQLVRFSSGGSITAWEAFGKSLLPPNRQPFSFFVDDVYQIVLVKSTEYEVALSVQDPFFVHQAGTYRYNKSPVGPHFFAPALTYLVDAADQALYILSWPQQAHIPTRYRSDLLALTRIRRVGETVLEAGIIVLNFGCDELEWANFPWGGVRWTVFPRLFIDRSSGALFELPVKSFADRAVVDDPAWNGIAVYTSPGESPRREAFGLAVPRVLGTTPSVWRSGVAGGSRPLARDFYVGTNAGALKLRPGDVMVGRYLIAAGPFHVVLSELRKLIGPDGLENLVFRPGSIQVSHPTCVYEVEGTSSCDEYSAQHIVPGFIPVFLFSDGTKKWTGTDIYEGVPREDSGGLMPWKRVIELEGVVGFVESDLSIACTAPADR